MSGFFQEIKNFWHEFKWHWNSQHNSYAVSVKFENKSFQIKIFKSLMKKINRGFEDKTMKWWLIKYHIKVSELKETICLKKINEGKVCFNEIH